MSSEKHSSKGSTPERKEDRSYSKKYKYCCRKCKHTEANRKSCVCVVPLSQRRTSLGTEGCQTCQCKGCSIQDFISRGEDPEYKPKFSHSRRSQEDSRQQRFDPRNGCCRKCMKAFSKNGKSCLCQVPKQVRKTKLSSQGCKICKCTGCNPRDFSQSKSSRSRSRSRSVSSGKESIDSKEWKLNNINSSVIGKVIKIEYGLNPGMLGMGIPQRTPSYILGKPL